MKAKVTYGQENPFFVPSKQLCALPNEMMKKIDAQRNSLMDLDDHKLCIFLIVTEVKVPKALLHTLVLVAECADKRIKCKTGFSLKFSESNNS